MNISKQDLKRIKEILGREYEYIKKYYYNVATTNKFEYKIFLNKKEEYLFRIFKFIFENYPEEIPNQEKLFKLEGLFGNEAVLNNNHLNLEDKKVLIVGGNLEINDDVTNIVNFIEGLNNFNNCNKENISVWFSYSTIDVDKERISSYIKHIIHDINTKRTSYNLTEMILSLNCGYTNNYDIYKIDNATIPIFSRLENPIIYENNSLNFSKNGISGKILFSNDILDLEDYSIKSCIRFYEKDNQTVIIPTIILPKIYKQNVYANCKRLLSHLEIEVPNKEKSESYIFNYTTKKISHLLLQKFWEKIGIENVNIDDYKIYNVDIEGILSFPSSTINKITMPNDNKYNYNKIKRIENYKQNVVDIVTKPNEDDLEKIIHQNLKNIDNEEIIAFIINLVDNECFKFNQANVNRNDYFEYNILEKDSQLYLAFYELYNEVFNYFYEFVCMTFECHYVKYLQFAEYFDKEKGTNDFTTFVNIVNRSDILDLFNDIKSILPQRLNKIYHDRYKSEIWHEVLEYKENMYNPKLELNL